MMSPQPHPWPQAAMTLPGVQPPTQCLGGYNPFDPALGYECALPYLLPGMAAQPMLG